MILVSSYALEWKFKVGIKKNFAKNENKFWGEKVKNRKQIEQPVTLINIKAYFKINSLCLGFLLC